MSDNLSNKNAVNKFEQVSSVGHKMSVAGGPQVNKFEQVSSVGHQMSVMGEVSQV